MVNIMNKKKNIGFRWLDKKFGDLRPVMNNNNFFYVDNNNSVIFSVFFNQHLMIDYDRIWSVFEGFLDLNENEISNLLIDWVKIKYNLKTNKCDYYYFYKYELYNPFLI